jgi:hypothetical protein
MTENIFNFEEALGVLQTASKTLLTTNAWIPSIKKYITLKEFTAKQQKLILESAIDSSLNKNKMSEILFSIISENCEEKDLVNNFTIIDKLSIIFSIRSQISEKIKITLNDNPLIEKEVDSNDIVNKFVNYTHPSSEILEFSKNDINIKTEISIPTLSEEIELDRKIYGEKHKETDIEELKNLITGAFLGESIKFIKEIIINEKAVGYDHLSYDNKLKIVENLPAALVKLILEKILTYKKEVEELYTVKEGDYSSTILIDNLLLN